MQLNFTLISTLNVFKIATKSKEMFQMVNTTDGATFFDGEDAISKS